MRRGSAADVRSAVWDAVATARRASCYEELAGERRELPLRLLRMQLGKAYREAERELNLLIDHAHEWDGGDYCSVCGQDGRA